MKNIDALWLNHERQQVVQVALIRQAINEECRRNVGKRLALSIALAFMEGPGRPDIFRAQNMVDVLKERIDLMASQATRSFSQ